MPMAIEATRLGSIGVPYWVTCLFFAGCISTEIAPRDSAPACVAADTAGNLANSVVLVDADLRTAGLIECSGVVIAPTIVVTNLLCVGLPIPLDPTSLDDTPERPSTAGRRLYAADVDYSGDCYWDASWVTREDGDFSARLGEVVEASSLSVSVLRNNETVATVGVRRMVLPNTDSRCWDTIALLVLDGLLSVPALPIRLQEVTSVGERVSLSGSGRGMNQPYEVSSILEAVTFDSGEAGAPPRSLLIDEQVCDFESGGAVAAADSGALIGIIGYGTGTFCGDPAGGTLATRLAPFQRMLMETARDTGEVLRAETPRGGSSSTWPDCAVD
jgi:hypothetical protein